MTGYIEFVDESVTISEIHKVHQKMFGPYLKQSIMGFFDNRISKEDNFGFESETK